MTDKVDKLAESYVDNGLSTVLRAFMQAIPILGGSLDTIFSWRGNHLQQRRLREWFEAVQNKMNSIEASTVLKSDLESDDFIDLVRRSVDSSSRTSSDLKRQALAEIIKKRISSYGSWDGANDATQIMNEIEEIDILLLSRVRNNILTEGAYKDFNAFSIDGMASEKSTTPSVISMRDILGITSDIQLRLSIQRMYRLGLINDEGIGRWSTGAGEVFVPSELANWFLDWIVE